MAGESEQHARDRDLIQGAVEGDRFAIRKLLLLNHDRLVEFVQRQVPVGLQGIIGAEDVCQETYVAAMRELRTFHPQGEDSFFRWLSTIAKHKLADLIRIYTAVRRGGKQALGQMPLDQTTSMICLLDLYAADVKTPSRSAAEHEIAAEINAALEGLKHEHREVLKLRYVRGFSLADTGRAMGRSEGAVLMLNHRALERLRERLGDPSRFFSGSR